MVVVAVAVVALVVVAVVGVVAVLAVVVVVVAVAVVPVNGYERARVDFCCFSSPAKHIAVPIRSAQA